MKNGINIFAMSLFTIPQEIYSKSIVIASDFGHIMLHEHNMSIVYF